MADETAMHRNRGPESGRFDSPAFAAQRVGRGIV